ncbi:cytochrome b5-like heme/steroid-binding domain protein (macronuclear) [Tetrahymena thermophila SB210]|uniref:Cytochrome b5-like heme/steroid-binding domain protein n=1 Tax=Tetrahymena thermophila (strain SB210) TaxID=312017 RepID=Q23CS6_TETTS|nr:cytochrome b5-like heme/steroid-binding domain protein [Tetrahymena thermophila SB210]EAR94589.1 cytochrome b5-like heme/steroid-binding domain protein [Tetrahymena thermophila SB210]|eukprot:XP_001014960.1 cytochrome b5-like heme/steroid-binding domain protein [Tetrahymena thermophila SB210]
MEHIFESFNATWIAYAIAAVVIIWQVYDFFNPKKPTPNAQPEIYQRLEEIKRQRRERNEKGVFNYKDLTKYNGFNNPQLYIAIKNDVFDVSNSTDFQEGGPYQPLVGNEVSVNFAKCVGDPEYFFKYGEVELTEEETKQLEATYAAFKANYKKVGTLYKNLPMSDNDKKHI